jgi:hypothetical protein
VEIRHGLSKDGHTSMEQNHDRLVRKMHTKIVAEYENLLHSYDKCPIETLKNESDRLLNSRETDHDDNMNKVQLDPMQNENNRSEQFCIPPQSVKRLLIKPYKCSLCNRYFTSQNQEQRHYRVHREDFPNVPITCMIRKGIPPQKKYHFK